MPDRGAPVAASVRDGLGDDIDSQPSRSSVFANWDPFIDPDGGPVTYEWCIGFAPGGQEVLPWTAIGGSTRGSIHDLHLQEGVQVHVSVRGTDLRGHTGEFASSNGVRVGQRSVSPPSDGETHATRTVPAAEEPRADPVVSGSDSAGRTRTISHAGITWTFDRPVTSGQFANGDWWVLGPVALIDIAPRTMPAGARSQHGSMLDPDPRLPRQGYDSAMSGGAANNTYDPGLNVALRVSPATPVQLVAGNSLISTISQAQPGSLPQLETCAILTCVGAVPPADALRPPYCGPDRELRWRTGALDLSRLQRLPPPPDCPDIDWLLEQFERPWLDHFPDWRGRYLHPRRNMPDYGRELADLVGKAALVLQLDIDPARKNLLVIRLVQYGIDCYGIIAGGGRFPPDGGSGSGRKLPALLAGVLLGDAAILGMLREHRFAFGEDAQTFHVTETAPGVWNGGHGGYGAADQGLAEWGNRHADDPSRDDKDWGGDPFRRCCTANAWVGFVLAARMMGLQAEWGHDALFDYMDRYLRVEPEGSWTRSFCPFAERMWDRYRARY